MTAPSPSANPSDRDYRAGLLMSMFLAAMMTDISNPEETREIVLIALQEPEFVDQSPDSFASELLSVASDLRKDPEAILVELKARLAQPSQKRRALELALRVATCDGIVTSEKANFLDRFRHELDLPSDILEEALREAQKRFVRFTMLYLVYLTATSDGTVDPAEFERMIPFVLGLPVFSGVSTDEFAFMSHSVRRHLDLMRSEKGTEYLAGTLLEASRQLDDPSIPRQALRLVARGIFADGVIEDSERTFFVQLASKLNIDAETGIDVMEKQAAESRERIAKLGGGTPAAD